MLVVGKDQRILSFEPCKILTVRGLWGTPSAFDLLEFPEVIIPDLSI